MRSAAELLVHRFEIGAWPAPGDLGFQFTQTSSPSLPWPLAIFSIFPLPGIAFTDFPIHGFFNSNSLLGHEIYSYSDGISSTSLEVLTNYPRCYQYAHMRHLNGSPLLELR